MHNSVDFVKFATVKRTKHHEPQIRLFLIFPVYLNREVFKWIYIDEELVLLHTTVELMEKEARLREELITPLKERNDLLELRIAELPSLLNEILSIGKDG